MAEVEDNILKIFCHNTFSRITCCASLMRVFQVLSSCVVTMVVMEAIFLFSSGALYISASPTLGDITVQSSRNASSMSLSSQQSPNINETSLIFSSPNETKTAGNASKLKKHGLNQYITEIIESTFINSKEIRSTVATEAAIVMTSMNTTTQSPAQRKLNQADIFYRVMIDYFIYLETMCSAKPVKTPQGKKKLCPCISPFLKGEIPVQQKDIQTFGELEQKFTKLDKGGHFRPKECHPRHRVSIIVPFRDREEHLNIFLNHMHPFLQRQLIEYRIFVVEEVPKKIFNKAMMMNIGFIEALKIFKDTDCIVFHDVDMLPENDKNLYACTDRPRHMGAFVNKWKYKLPYKTLVGGAISMTPEQFHQINGYSNEFFGWGGEDDDFYQRMKAQGMEVERYPKEVSKYTTLKHQRDRLNPRNPKKAVSNTWRPKHYAENGLNSLKYNLKSIVYKPLYTWIEADIEVP